MRSGAIFGYRGLVREILARIKAEQFSRKKVVIVATGGYARLIASQVPEVAVIHPHLTLEGLRIIGNLNNRAQGRTRRFSVNVKRVGWD